MSGLPPTVVQQHPHLALAVRQGVLTVYQVDEALSVQQASAKAGSARSLDEILIRKGYISGEKLAALRAESPKRSANKVFGEYEILGKLGEGMMGKVYKARHVPTGRIVALKVLFPELAKDASLLERFLREARAVSKLRHPHIVAGFDVGCINKLYFIAMEFVDGFSLDRRLKRDGRLSEGEALEICRQVALALDHAHRTGYLHRDVKPENVLLTGEGKAKLTDLGLARSLGPTEGTKLTAEGATVGSPHYISPEQAQGLSEIDFSTDLYSLGVMLFECLTGKVPFDDEEFYVVMLKHVNDPAPDPRTLNPAISEATAMLVLKLMSKEPQDRSASAAECAAEMEALQKRLAPPASKAVGANGSGERSKNPFAFQ